jgi:hypothetical protein
MHAGKRFLQLCLDQRGKNTVTRFFKLYFPALNSRVLIFVIKEGSTLLEPVQGIVYLVTWWTVSWYVIKSVRNVSAECQTKKMLYVSSFDWRKTFKAAGKCKIFFCSNWHVSRQVLVTCQFHEINFCNSWHNITCSHSLLTPCLTTTCTMCTNELLP